MLIFDIETGPLADDYLEQMFSFDAPPAPGEFDPSSVKYGNTKDEAKRAAKLEECRAAHDELAKLHPLAVKEARADAWRQFKDRAALSPATGKVLAIGLCNSEGKTAITHGDGDESKLLGGFWELVKKKRGKDRFIGWNSNGFDLPFLVRRSWILGIDPPGFVYSCSGKWVNFDQSFVDLRNIWLLGQSWGDCESSLDAAAKALGFNGKLDKEVTGADFARLWYGTAEEHDQAVAYLINDLVETKKVAARLGFV